MALLEKAAGEGGRGGVKAYGALAGTSKVGSELLKAAPRGKLP